MKYCGCRHNLDLDRAWRWGREQYHSLPIRSRRENRSMIVHRRRDWSAEKGRRQAIDIGCLIHRSNREECREEERYSRNGELRQNEDEETFKERKLYLIGQDRHRSVQLRSMFHEGRPRSLSDLRRLELEDDNVEGSSHCYLLETHLCPSILLVSDAIDLRWWEHRISISDDSVNDSKACYDRQIHLLEREKRGDSFFKHINGFLLLLVALLREENERRRCCRWWWLTHPPIRSLRKTDWGSSTMNKIRRSSIRLTRTFWEGEEKYLSTSLKSPYDISHFFLEYDFIREILATDVTDGQVAVLCRSSVAGSRACCCLSCASMIMFSHLHMENDKRLILFLENSGESNSVRNRRTQSRQITRTHAHTHTHPVLFTDEDFLFSIDRRTALVYSPMLVSGRWMFCACFNQVRLTHECF